MAQTTSDSMRYGFVFQLIDGLILSAILIVSILYSLYYSNFAEMHIQLSFLDFPIFVGEILMFFCLALGAIKLVLIYLRGELRLDRWHYAFLLYGFWVLARALYGYFTWGPLAFRNAAVFYYPVFLFITYHALPKGLSDPFKIAVLVLLAVIYFYGQPYGYFDVAYVLLSVVLYLSLKDSRFKREGLLITLVVVAFSTKQYFAASRSHLVAFFVMLLYVAFAQYFIYKDRISRKYQALIVSFIVLYCGFGLWKYSDHNSLKSLVVPFEIIKQYQDQVELIRKKEPGHVFLDLKPKLYNENIREEVPAVSEEPIVVTEEALILPSETAVSAEAPIEQAPPELYRPLDSAIGNSVFRLLIWRDMAEELWSEKAIFGINFGKPQRSRSMEITDWAYGEWARDGWITPHNSFFHVIYRAGIIGVVLLALLCWRLYSMHRAFMAKSSIAGCLLIGILLYWMVLANFLVVLELPYFAIPFWSIFGLGLAYYHRSKADFA